MRHDLLSGRRLRFPVEVGERESIPGAIARGVRQHVLVRTAPVLEAAGVDLRHIGMAQIATPEELERLAYVARIPANDLVERAGVRLVTRDDDRSHEARFGDLVIPRAYVEFNRRRIGPTRRLLRHFVANRWHLVDSWQHALHSWGMDTLVLWGERDDVTPPSGADEIQALLPDARIVLLDAGHDVLATKATDVAREVDAFLNYVAVRQ